MGKTSLTVRFTVSHKGKSDNDRQREKIRALLVEGTLREGFFCADLDLESMEFVGHPELEDLIIADLVR